MSLSNSAKLRFMYFGILNTYPVQELPDAVRDLRRYKPHQDVLFAALLERVFVTSRVE